MFLLASTMGDRIQTLQGTTTFVHTPAEKTSLQQSNVTKAAQRWWTCLFSGECNGAGHGYRS